MTEEPALDPGLEICDPHHHLWEYPDAVYAIDELRADVASHRVTSTVFVECGSAYWADGPVGERPVGETEWVRSVAPDDGLVAAIVGFADLTVGAAVEGVLERHVEAGRGRFRGIRHVASWDGDPRIHTSHSSPPPHLLAHAGFGEGVAALGRAGLLFEAWLYFPQLPELVTLAQAHPNVKIVLDHLGGPIGIGPYTDRDAVLATWRESMRAVAACTNVVLKLGGIGMPIFGMDWHHRASSPGSEEVASVWGPEIRWCIEEFGVDRCMFESNFPVDKRSFSYSVCWNAFLRIGADLSDDERRALFHENAVQIYDIGNVVA